MAAYEAWRLEMDMPVVVWDAFGRTVSNGWGAADSAQAWTLQGGVAGDYRVSGTAGVISAGVVNSPRGMLAPESCGDADIVASFMVPVVPAGAGIACGLVARWQASGDCYLIEMVHGASGDLVLQLTNVVAGVATVVASVQLFFVTSATGPSGYPFRLRGRVSGSLLQVKAWPASWPEPPTWHLAAIDATVPYAGYCGVRVLLQTGYSGSTPVDVTVDDLTVTVPTRWIPISAWADTIVGPIRAQLGDSAETSGEPSRASVTLANADQRWTPQNPLSPYGPNVQSGRRLRMLETTGYVTQVPWAGFAQWPAIAAWTPSTASAPRDQQITVPVVDIMSRLDGTDVWLSTVSAFVQINPALRAHWPMHEPALPFSDVVGGMPDIAEVFGASGTSLTATGGRSQVIGQQGSVASDDLPVAYVDATTGTNPIGGATIVVRCPDLRVSWAYAAAARPRIGIGQVATMVAWLRPDLLADMTCFLLGLTAGSASLLMTVTSTGAISVLSSGALTGTINGPNLPATWTPMALRYGFNPSTFELWLGRQRFTGALAGAAPTSDTISDLALGTGYRGGIGHLQLYVGLPSEFSFTHYLEQVDVAWTGLDRQTTGQRIRTLTRLGGVSVADVGDIDPGVAVMAPMQLAGQTVGQAIRSAAETEQGRLWVDGGRLRFDDRRRVFNV